MPDMFVLPAPGAVRVWREDSADPARAEVAPWPASVSWLFVRSPGFQENRSQGDAPRPAPGSDQVAIVIERPGTSIVGLDLPARVAEVDAGVVAGARGESEPSERSATRASVRVVESAKAIVQVGAPAGEPDAGSVATSKTGQAVEIRPLMEPTTTPIGSDMALRVYVGGDAASDGVMRAVNVEAGVDAKLKIRAGGFSHLTLSAPGVWRIEYRCARPGKGGDDPAWTLYRATLTFRAQGAPEEVRPAPSGESSPPTEAPR